jgi:hypothetical protein
VTAPAAVDTAARCGASAGARRGPRPRRAFILGTVLIVAIVIAALAIAYRQGALHRGVQVRAHTDRIAARFLARAALEAMKFAVGEATLPPAVPAGADASSLYSLLLLDPAGLARALAGNSGAAPAGDDRALLDRLMGPEALAPLDRLAAGLPSARTSIAIGLAGASLYPASAMRDPVLKRVTLRVRATADVRGARESMSTSETLVVHSLLPGAAGKFTLAATGLAGANGFPVTVDGHEAPGATGAPIVLFHHAGDLDPGAQDPFAGATPAVSAPPAARPLVTRPLEPDRVLPAAADRGLVLLEGPPEQPAVHLQLASGGAPWGEHYTMFQPAGGKTAYPAARLLADQPARLRAFRPPDPVDPSVEQAAFVQGTVLGFSEGMNVELLGPPPDPDAIPTASTSRIRPFGTATHPSPTACIGEVYRVMAALSDVAIDRDATDKDESDQTACAGARLPVRDAVDPFLAWCDEETFREDLANEQGPGDPTYRRLTPFGRRGGVPNQNARVDLDGDGVRETPVPSEDGHDPIHLDLTLWKYANLFADHAEYRAVMSRYLVVPANESLLLAGLPREQAEDRLRGAAFGLRSRAATPEYLVRDLRLEHRDPLHAGLAGGGPALRTCLDTTGLQEGSLRAAIHEGTLRHHPDEPVHEVRGQREFERLFMPSGMLDLQGLRVAVLPDGSDGPPPLVFDRVVQVRPGGGGILEAPAFSARGLVNPGLAEAFAPLVIRTGELVLAGPGPFEAIFVPARISQVSEARFTTVRGGFVLAGALPGALVRPLVVAHDDRYDPTSPAVPLYYRVAFAPVRPRVYERPAD